MRPRGGRAAEGDKGKAPTQSWQIREGFPEEVTSKKRPEGRGEASGRRSITRPKDKRRLVGTVNAK